MSRNGCSSVIWAAFRKAQVQSTTYQVNRISSDSENNWVQGLGVLLLFLVDKLDNTGQDEKVVRFNHFKNGSPSPPLPPSLLPLQTESHHRVFPCIFLHRRSCCLLRLGPDGSARSWFIHPEPIDVGSMCGSWGKWKETPPPHTHTDKTFPSISPHHCICRWLWSSHNGLAR